MEPVRYYIPTRGRVGKQLTLSHLPTGLHSLVTLVCPAEEVAAHRADWPDVQVVTQPEDIRTIRAKREWIYKTLAEDVEFAWQLDDDLSIKVLSHWNFRKPDPEEDYYRAVWVAIHNLYFCDKGFEVIGLGTSYFAPKGGIKPNYHLGFAFGFSKAAREQLEMNRLDVFEDIDYTLQVLRKGIKNGVCYDLVVDQKQPDAPGGVT